MRGKNCQMPLPRTREAPDHSAKEFPGCPAALPLPLSDPTDDGQVLSLAVVLCHIGEPAPSNSYLAGGAEPRDLA
jgi:hypothetical protein